MEYSTQQPFGVGGIIILDYIQPRRGLGLYRLTPRPK